jgi:hypothetical protein
VADIAREGIKDPAKKSPFLEFSACVSYSNKTLWIQGPSIEIDSRMGAYFSVVVSFFCRLC